MHRKQRWSGRGLPALLATGVLLGAGLLASGAGIQAAYAASGPPINGGVEDGAFTQSCLSGTTAPDTGVLKAYGYRDKLGNVVRIIVPYNIAVNTSGKEFKCLNSYLTDASRYGAAVEVSLDQGASHPAGPSLKQYTAAITDLHRTLGGRIAYLTAWNEPDNTSYLQGSNPAKRAGQYYVAASQAFGSKVAAGDFSSGVPASFLSSYLGPISKAHLHPGTWAIHPYTDVSNFQYYMHDKKSPQVAGQLAAASSKVLQLATGLRADGYGPGTDLWINEIYIDHTSDKNPPPGIPGAKGQTMFSARNQGYAALFLSGGLGADSLPGELAGKDLPQLTRYIYLRAWDNGKKLPDADVLQVHAPGCVYYTLAGGGTTPAPQCS
jgi:hypothetical protein